eukprot:752506-Hanusia_phi.AAC.7
MLHRFCAWPHHARGVFHALPGLTDILGRQGGRRDNGKHTSARPRVLGRVHVSASFNLQPLPFLKTTANTRGPRRTSFVTFDTNTARSPPNSTPLLPTDMRAPGITCQRTRRRRSLCIRPPGVSILPGPVPSTWDERNGRSRCCSSSLRGAGTPPRSSSPYRLPSSPTPVLEPFRAHRPAVTIPGHSLFHRLLKLPRGAGHRPGRALGPYGRRPRIPIRSPWLSRRLTRTQADSA